MEDVIELLIYIVSFILFLAIGMAVAYFIGESNLPDWVKFWLLN